MDALKVILIVLLSAILGQTLRSSDFYLPQVGPTPLRFAPVPAKNFKWPVTLKPAPMATNDGPIVIPSEPITNEDVVLTATSPDPLPNNSSGSFPETYPAGPPLMPQLPFGLNGNGLSASNLLILTPQMLADYFKANLNSVGPPPTNGPASNVPFNPPTPKIPSSAAMSKTK